MIEESFVRGSTSLNVRSFVRPQEFPDRVANRACMRKYLAQNKIRSARTPFTEFVLRHLSLHNSPHSKAFVEWPIRQTMDS